MGGPGGLAACRHSLEEPGGSDKLGKVQKLQAVLPGLEQESRTQLLHEPQLEPAGHCNWLWRDGNRPGEAGYWGRGERREIKWKKKENFKLLCPEGNSELVHENSFSFLTVKQNKGLLKNRLRYRALITAVCKPWTPFTASSIYACVTRVLPKIFLLACLMSTEKAVYDRVTYIDTKP